MKKQLQFLEILGGALGMGATFLMVQPRFAVDGPSELYFDQLPGNIILTMLLLVPFAATIASVIILPGRARWPVLLFSALLSLVWLTVSSLANNFPRAPTPTPATPWLWSSTGFFLPAAVVLITATALSMRQELTALQQRRAVVLVASTLAAVCVLSASLYILFLNQESELWSRADERGEWVVSPDPTVLPPFPTGASSQEIRNEGVVSHSMALLSSGLLATGIVLLGILFNLAGQSGMPKFKAQN